MAQTYFEAQYSILFMPIHFSQIINEGCKGKGLGEWGLTSTNVNVSRSIVLVVVLMLPIIGQSDTEYVFLLVYQVSSFTRASYVIISVLPLKWK